jgi:UDPglucose 6-dehydrogenase
MTNKILIFGAGYVGYSLALTLDENYSVVIVEKDKKKIDKINNQEAPISDYFIDQYIQTNPTKFIATDSPDDHLKNSKIIILALPTNFDQSSNSFDTSIMDSVLKKLNNSNINADIVIKSTIPIGYTNRSKKKYQNLSLFFVPEFLRENRAIEDTLYPSRIIIGDKEENATKIAKIFKNTAKNNPKIFYMNASEAEAVKLFANSFLAMRISFFNELDSFAIHNELNTQNIIEGVCSDNRIGQEYNNPSFGYGGYCLPKDTRQLVANFEEVPQSIFTATIESNKKRKDFLTKKILEKNIKKIGIFRLVMKKDSDNFRESAVFDIINTLIKEGKDILVYEPLMHDNNDLFEVTHDLNYFNNICELIIANRMDDQLLDVKEKVFTRDIYGKN